jgi:hypothetical protein
MNHTMRNDSLPALFAFRPLSLATAALCLATIAFALSQRLAGNMYLEQLHNIDAFTPVMISALMLRGLWALRQDTDLQAVSISLITALSFVFVYEAVYKILFYLPPKTISSEELREFLIHSGTGLTVLAGFAFGKLRLSRVSLLLLGAFALLYTFWLLSGFPQIDHVDSYYPAVIPVPFTWNTIYAVNRSTKVILFLAYFSLHWGDRTPGEGAEQNPAALM